MIKTRLNIQELEPAAYEAMFSMESYLSKTTLNPLLVEIIRLKASQINGCAYCVELHSKAAMNKGATTEKLFALSAWKESPLFSDRERAVLEMTEEITNISKAGLSDNTFEKVKLFFSENEIAQLIMLIGTINIWNRMAISMHLFHQK